MALINLTGKTKIKFDIRASRTGSNIKIGIHDSGGTTTEIIPNITVVDTYQTVIWDISAVSDANKDAIDSIIVTVINADAANTFYIDNMFSLFSQALLVTESGVVLLGKFASLHRALLVVETLVVSLTKLAPEFILVVESSITGLTEGWFKLLSVVESSVAVFTREISKFLLIEIGRAHV